MANPRTLCVLRPPSTPHLAYSLLQFGLHVALPRIALSHVGRQNELTFVGAISSTCPKSEQSVFIRLFLIRGPIRVTAVGTLGRPLCKIFLGSKVDPFCLFCL